MDCSLLGSSAHGTRQEYWNESSPGHLPNPGIKPRSPTLQTDPLLSEPPGKPSLQVHITQTQIQISHHIQPIHFSISYSLDMSNISIFIKSVGTKDQNEICIWKSSLIGSIPHLAKRIMRYAFFFNIMICGNYLVQRFQK